MVQGTQRARDWTVGVLMDGGCAVESPNNSRNGGLMSKLPES